MVYLRPETAQGIFVNFRNVRETSRKKLPFGIAQIGKAFRNEISPGNFVFRMREFEQMEMQYFVKPETAAATFEEWLPRRQAWYERYGVDAGTPALPRARAGRAGPLRQEGRSTSSTASRSAGRSWRASTTAATGTSAATRRPPARTSSTSTRRPRSTTSPGSSRPRPAATGRPSRS